jgi:hypothetical protein
LAVVEKIPRARGIGTRNPVLVVNCSFEGETVGIDGGVKDPCGGAEPTT